MEYNLKTQPVYTLKEVMNTFAQQPIDLDVTLPDYCADMEKILKCTVSVKIFSRTLSAGQLRIDGTSLVSVFYTDSDRKHLRCTEQTVPFSVTLNTTADVTDYVILCDAKPEYISCRALTPRRLVLHGAIELHTRLLTREAVELFTNEEDNDLETSLMSIEACQLKFLSQDRFAVSETISVNTKKSVESIIRSRLTAKITDYRISSGQLTLRGELLLRMLYTTDAATSELDRFVTTIPFSQTLKIPDETQDICRVNVEISSYDVTLKSELMSEETALAVEASLIATAEGYENTEVSYITDAYSTCYSTELKSEKLRLLTKVSPIDITATTKTTLSMGDTPVQKIIDIFSDSVKATCEMCDDLIKILIRCDVTMLAVNNDDEIVCVDRQVNFVHEYKPEGEYSCVDSLSACVSSLSFRLGESNDMELRIEVGVSGILMKNETIVCATGIEQLQKCNADDKAPLVIYYADKGEEVWEIAKNFRTPLNSLREENSLEDDVLQSNTMLMIVNV